MSLIAPFLKVANFARESLRGAPADLDDHKPDPAETEEGELEPSAQKTLLTEEQSHATQKPLDDTDTALDSCSPKAKKRSKKRKIRESDTEQDNALGELEPRAKPSKKRAKKAKAREPSPAQDDSMDMEGANLKLKECIQKLNADMSALRTELETKIKEQKLLETAAREEAESARKETRAIRSELEKCQSISSTLKDTLQRQKVSFNKLKYELDKTQQELNQARSSSKQIAKLLDLRTTELEGTRTFLSTDDRHSVADVTRMVESLNSEVYQTSAGIVDAVFPTFEGTTPGSKDAVAARQEIVSLLGTETVERLGAIKSQDDPEALIQSSLQNCLLYRSWEEIQAWCAEPITSRILAQTHSEIQESGKPRPMTLYA